MNLLENCFGFYDPWSLLLVNLTLTINLTDFWTKKKTTDMLSFKKIFTGPGSCLVPGVDHLDGLLFLLLVLLLHLLGLPLAEGYLLLLVQLS